MIAKFFRFVNAKLIYTDNIVLEKILKIFFFISLSVYRRKRKNETIKGNSVVVITNFDGDISMKIDRSRSIGKAIYWTGFHEFREFLFLERYIKSDMVFVDIGANQGEYALFAAKRLTAGKVLAFEPLKSIRDVLTDNIKLNNFGNIEVFECGLSDKDAVLQIHEIEDVHEGLATVYLGDRKSKSTFSIQLKSLDDVFVNTNLKRLDLIKIDIEGGELNALIGSRHVINTYKPIVMIEINDETYRAAGYSITDVENFFNQLNYTAFDIGKRGAISRCSKLPSFGNIIFMPS